MGRMSLSLLWKLLPHRCVCSLVPSDKIVWADGTQVQRAVHPSLKSDIIGLWTLFVQMFGFRSFPNVFCLQLFLHLSVQRYVFQTPHLTQTTMSTSQLVLENLTICSSGLLRSLAPRGAGLFSIGHNLVVGPEPSSDGSLYLFWSM